jgi:hypothetical protein
MASGYTIFFSYQLESTSGYSSGIHCNYINKVVLDDISNKEINFYFSDIDDFKFLSSGSTEATGYTANKIYLIAQIVSNSAFVTIADVKPTMGEWRKYDVTSQITGYYPGYVDGNLLSPTYLAGSIFKFPLYKYYDVVEMPLYNLDYLNYPSSTYTGGTESNKPLYLGDEQYFIGNVSTDIEAIAYTSDISITLPLNQFNSTNNATWDGSSKVYITEIGIYDDEKNLVAIGKLNNPIPKDSSISRTIVFAIDF